MRIEYNHVTYSFPDEALTGTDAPVIEATVCREGASAAAGDDAGAAGSDSGASGSDSGASDRDVSHLTYRVFSQRRQGSHYLSAHGCSLCALTTLIGALADPSVTPSILEAKRTALLGLQPPVPPGPLARSRRMPLNIAGLYRIASLYMNAELLDRGSDEQIRSFILDRASRGIPVLATGKRIPSLSGSPLCPRSAHTFLIIGTKDPSTLIIADSTGLNDERIKFVDIDQLIPGLLRNGTAAALKKRRYYYNRLWDGGLLSVHGV